MALQWNANEKAWASKHGVQLGQKKVGGLANLAAYKNISGGGGGGGKPAGGGSYSMQPKSPAAAAAPAAASMAGGMAANKYANLTAQKAAGWTDAQKSWLAANDPDKLKYGQSLMGAGGGGGGQAPMQGGLIKGRTGGAQAAMGAGQPTMSKKSGMGALLGGALGAAGAGGFSLGGMKIAQAASMGALKSGAIGAGLAASPIGWGIAGAMLGASLLGKGKSNQQFEGTLQTGGHQAWKQARPGDMAQIKKGYIPTAEEFTQHGRWLMPEDKYAHDYGRTFGGNDAKYYDAFRKQAQGFLDQAAAGDKMAMAHYRNVMGAHGFDIEAAPKPAEAPKARSAPAPAPTSLKAPAPIEPGDKIEKPTSGLEDTIKRKTHEGETIVRNYLGPGRDSVYIAEDEESKRRRKKSYGTALAAAR